MSDKTPAQLASTSADAVRALIHATFASPQAEWEFPGDAYSVVGGLSELARMLPQALDQIARHVEQLHTAGHIRSDRGGDGAGEVADALRALEFAAADAGQLSSRLETVHSALGPLAYKY
ncbi:hypothetical protein [Streptomyces nitrosporeus]|uniref:hypothetical protein n=1 Tax=Streptomyces nitrosporeus TaxID=28894 RepID=UPI00167D4183|nr:hypothetical protein [Streptomyces nitrosporeus]GGZ28111.1 hypothetical protein GCM10010327_68230 [Streptomyces nitrosporeus]